jgi:aspartyl-tRNA(Asn)/glutamyl-tRNA(Gln) amidotransferase subunit A
MTAPLSAPATASPASSPVGASFQAALAAIAALPIELDWRPAFLDPLRDLPIPPRTPLPDLPAPRPRRAPFCGQPLTVAAAAAAIAAGDLTAVAVMQRALAAMAARQVELNAFVYTAPAADLLAAAAAVDASRAAARRAGGPLAGIPIAVKDLLAVSGMPNTASSPVLAGRVEVRDASSIAALKDAGAIITGKTQTHEFALGVTTPQSRNPWDPTRDPGGSSGGSAIAVATGMSLAAMATDTRASVRVPASLCGVVGYKPTYGLVKGDGVLMLSWSLDHVAHLTLNVEDAAILLDVLAPPAAPALPYTAALHKDVSGLRVGIPTAALAGADPAVAQAFTTAAAALQAAGVLVEEVASPSAADFDAAVLLGLVVSRCEAAAYHTAFPAPRPYATAAVAEQMAAAAEVPAVAYLQAQRARADLRARMLGVFTEFDGLLMPTTRVAAPPSTDVDAYFLVLSQNCILWSFIGFPVISVPCGWTGSAPGPRLPVGAQLVAGPYADHRLLALAAALEAGIPA